MVKMKALVAVLSPCLGESVQLLSVPFPDSSLAFWSARPDPRHFLGLKLAEGLDRAIGFETSGLEELLLSHVGDGSASLSSKRVCVHWIRDCFQA